MPPMKVTNKFDGPRGIFTLEGVAVVPKGESRILDVSEADQKANKDYFDFEKSDQKTMDAENANVGPELNEPVIVPDADAFDALSDEALREHIEDVTGKKPDGRSGRAKLLELARNS